MCSKTSGTAVQRSDGELNRKCVSVYLNKIWLWVTLHDLKHLYICIIMYNICIYVHIYVCLYSYVLVHACVDIITVNIGNATTHHINNLMDQDAPSTPPIPIPTWKHWTMKSVKHPRLFIVGASINNYNDKHHFFWRQMTVSPLTSIASLDGKLMTMRVSFILFV